MNANTDCRALYQGDDALAGLLRKAGSRYDVASVKAIVRGVLAAPPARDADVWCRLIAADPSPALTAQLQALKATIAAEPEPAALSVGERLNAVRALMAAAKLDGWLVPRADEYQNEYVPACNERLAWLTGFTGSAGFAIVLAQKAAIFVDGRYTIQVAAETDAALFEPHHLIDEPPETWVASALPSGSVVGYDPRVLTPNQRERFSKALGRVHIALQGFESNLLDDAWGAARPPEPLGVVMPHGETFTGRSVGDKRREIAALLEREGRDALIVTAADSLAWLIDVRGADVPRTPLALGFGVLHATGRLDLYIDDRKLLPEVSAHLGNQIVVRPPGDLAKGLEALGGKIVQVDPATAAQWFIDRLEEAGAKLVRDADPITLPKALKNAVELDGSRAAHRRDGAAMVRFLAWLDTAAAGGTLREIEASDRLESFRAEGDRFRDLSFDTISGAGPNGAIVHYRASPATERVLEPNSLYLVDSGAQYLDGTTDITRTIAIGEPSAEMRDRFTRVLKGHIALARVVFPKGTTGSQLDALARQFLWSAGVTYDHGTGHGVGSFLSVHEGPQRIGTAASIQPLLPGMILSNEPGYYKTGGYGIRIENLQAVVPREIPGAEREMLGFETLTFCPIDRRAIDRDLLTDEERAWVDGYHRRVRETLTPLVADGEALRWLEAATTVL